MLKNKPFWFSTTLIAAYLLTAYFAVPQWLQPKLEQYVSQKVGRQLQFENLQFDPLTWSVELTGVRLVHEEQGAAGEPGEISERGLFPSILLSAEAVHLRFNFWRLHAAVSTLKVKAPVLVIDGNSPLMQAGRYPFAGQWQQWHSVNSLDAEHPSVAIQQWQLEGGRMLLAYPGKQKADVVLLDDVLMQAGKADDAGQREYQLAFTAANGSAVSTQGQMDGHTLASSGQYLWEASLPQTVNSGFRQAKTAVAVLTEFNASGDFGISMQGDSLLIRLTQSQLSSDQAGRCVLDELLCARIFPLDFSFAATLQAATDGVRLLTARVQQQAFEMDATMAHGAVMLDQQLAFESARLQIRSSSEPTVMTDATQHSVPALQFELVLQSARDPLLNVEFRGQFQPESEHARMEFVSQGEPDLRGNLQWQWIAANQAEAAYPQLQLRLENPAASLAQGFTAEHLSNGLEAADLQLQLTATLGEGQLSYSESIRLQQVGASPTDAAPHASQFVGQGVLPNEHTLDAAWLLALLQNPQSGVELEIPGQHILLTEQISLQSLIQDPILSKLRHLIANRFEGLALQMGKRGERLEEVQFESGSAELSAKSSESLAVLADALMQRPGLGLELAGVYDPVIDKKVLQTEQIRTHIALATAAELSFQSGSEPPDFSDPKVHSVIDEFARRRLPAEVLSAFAGFFGEADVDRGVIPEGDVSSYYSALFELLVDYADIPQGALSTLAHYRAQTVIDLLEGQGVSRDRLYIAPQPRSIAARLDGVPLPFQLRIYSSEGPELLEDSSSGL